MRRPAEFSATVRAGRRVGGRSLVVHHVDGGAATPATVGLVVGKAVGNSVVRHRVSRRLRAQLAVRLDRLSNGSATVVRALPSAGSATSVELGDEIDRALNRLAGRR